MSDAATFREICAPSGGVVWEGGMHSTSEFICRSDCALSQGAEIVQLILDHGKLRPPDIMSQLSTSDPKGD